MKRSRTTVGNAGGRRSAGSWADQATELKSRIACRLSGAIASNGRSKGEIAEAMGTSRSSLDRLLDPAETGLTLKTLVRAASVFGLELVVELRPRRRGSGC